MDVEDEYNGDDEDDRSKRVCGVSSGSGRGVAGSENQLARVIRNVVLGSIDGQSQRERLGQVCMAADQGELKHDAFFFLNKIRELIYDFTVCLYYIMYENIMHEQCT